MPHSSLSRFLLVTVLLAVAGHPPALAADPMPKTLVIGYDNEGKVDGSDQACREFVMQTVDWDKPQVDQGVNDVCAARKKHIDAYAALQKGYGDFRGVLSQQPRFDGALAAQNLSQMLHSCIDHKWAITTGGHNIGLDIIPNDIATECLNIGRDLLAKETAFLKGG